MRLNLLVVGSENPRIRDFFGEVARDANVSYLDTSPITRLPSLDKLCRSWRWRKRGTDTAEAHLLVPKRYQELSTSLTHWFCRRSFAQFGKADAVIFTWPQLCFLAEKFTDITRVYYCKDPFELWMWGPEFIRPLETRLLNNVDAVFAVSRLLTWDLAPRTTAKTFYLPNGFCDWFVPEADSPRPRDLPPGKPVIGSVGQINDDYDWDYVQYIAEELPDVNIAFLGNLKEPDPTAERRIHRILTRTPNILWLGWRKYDRVPVYMHHCDILMNFLKADDLGNRRSPLRLYDYLTTSRPIISTGVAEAYPHKPHIHVAADGPQAVQAIREILAGRHPLDLEARRQYASNQSWQVRARQFLDELTPIIAARQNPAKPPHPAHGADRASLIGA
jgi:glycosyltransferase involved in cell wall biosynthesis